MTDNEGKRAEETRQEYNLKPAEEKLAEFGYHLSGEVETYPPAIEVHHFMFLYYNTDKNHEVAIHTPGMTLVWGTNGPEYMIDDFLKDSWLEP